jgi:putative endonuclease
VSEKRLQAWRLGHRAEAYTTLILRCRGYRLLATRWKSPFGEIDLIMRRGETICFIEVKARAQVDAGLESLRPQQCERIRRAAQLWLSQQRESTLQPVRFDLMVISGWRWQHVRNAF